MFLGVRRWDIVTMYIIVAVMFTFEMLGVTSDKMVSLTQIIKQWIPLPCRVMVLSWLVWHFFISDVVAMIITRTTPIGAA